jgi:Ca2+-binding RTX toxin-like protein
LFGGAGDTLIGGSGIDTAHLALESFSNDLRIDLSKSSNIVARVWSLQSIEILFFSSGEGKGRIVGGAFADTVIGGGGDDTVIGGAGADSLYGEYGSDLLEGGSGNDSLWGGNFYYYGDLGTNTIEGGDGNDIIANSYASDLISGGTGDDRVVMGGYSNVDSIDGGEGRDSVSFVVEFQDNGPVLIDLADQSKNAGVAYGAVFTSVERLEASRADDVLRGASAAEELLGLQGDDLLNGGAGDDRLVGGEGYDTISGAAGKDLIALIKSVGLDQYGSPLSVPLGFDEIVGFKPGTDRLEVDLVAFGMESKADFHLVSGKDPVAKSDAPTFLFDSVTHELTFDSDGKGGNDDGTLIAILDGVTKLTASDFLIVLSIA